MLIKYIFSIFRRNIMSKAHGNLKNKKMATRKSSATLEKSVDAAVSPYFSPKKTRNHIKIESEKHRQIIKEPLRVENENNSVIPSTSTTIQRSENDGKIDRKTKTKKRKSEATNEITATAAKQDKWEPKNWHPMLINLQKMRKNKLAPVDTMGCHKCSDQTADEKTQRYQTLVALMLSSQTKDQTTYDAMNRLKTHGLTPENIVQTKASILDTLISPVSFYKTKTKHIQQTAQILIDLYNSDIPKSVEELIKLPGVGPKMAHICMHSAWNIITGIGVDTHVHRIANRLHWLPKPTKEPEKTRIELEKWLPRHLWHEVNELMVGFGQTICTPTNPKCGECLNADICPSKGVKK